MHPSSHMMTPCKNMSRRPWLLRPRQASHPLIRFRDVSNECTRNGSLEIGADGRVEPCSSAELWITSSTSANSTDSADLAACVPSSRAACRPPPPRRRSSRWRGCILTMLGAAHPPRYRAEFRVACRLCRPGGLGLMTQLRCRRSTLRGRSTPPTVGRSPRRAFTRRCVHRSPSTRTSVGFKTIPFVTASIR